MIKKMNITYIEGKAGCHNIEKTLTDKDVTMQQKLLPAVTGHETVL